MSASKPKRPASDRAVAPAGISQKTQQFGAMPRPKKAGWAATNAAGQDTVSLARIARGSAQRATGSQAAISRTPALLGPTHTLRAAPPSEQAAEGTRIANVGEFVSREGSGDIASAGLGSCIAIVGWSAAAKMGGMLHFMLPSSDIDQARSESNPTMFCDTGLQVFAGAFASRGIALRDLRIWLVGGASMHESIGAFDVGRRNLLAARQQVWRLGLQVFGEAVGGTAARTATLSVGTGRLVIREPGQSPREL